MSHGFTAGTNLRAAQLANHVERGRNQDEKGEQPSAMREINHDLVPVRCRDASRLTDTGSTQSGRQPEQDRSHIDPTSIKPAQPPSQCRVQGALAVLSRYVLTRGTRAIVKPRAAPATERSNGCQSVAIPPRPAILEPRMAPPSDKRTRQSATPKWSFCWP
jgi:hypothetical protein